MTIAKPAPWHLLMLALTNHRKADGTPSFSWEDQEECRTSTEVLTAAVTHLLLMTDGKL